MDKGYYVDVVNCFKGDYFGVLLFFVYVCGFILFILELFLLSCFGMMLYLDICKYFI